jgi:hypothetical protein
VGRDLGLEDDPKGLGPGAGGIVQLGIQAGLGRRVAAGPNGILSTGLVPFPGRLEGRLSQALQHCMSSQTEDEIEGRVFQGPERIRAFSVPVGRLPGRNTAVMSLPESPSKINSGR